MPQLNRFRGRVRCGSFCHSLQFRRATETDPSVGVGIQYSSGGGRAELRLNCPRSKRISPAIGHTIKDIATINDLHHALTQDRQEAFPTVPLPRIAGRIKSW